MQQVCRSPKTPEHVSSVNIRSGSRRIPRCPSRIRARGASCDSLDTPLYLLASISSQHGSQMGTKPLLQQSITGPPQQVPVTIKPAEMGNSGSGAIPKPRGLNARSPESGHTKTADYRSSTEPCQVTSPGADWQSTLCAERSPASTEIIPLPDNKYTNGLIVPQASNLSSGRVSEDSIGARTDGAVVAGPLSMLRNSAAVSAAMDAAYSSSALKVGVQQVVHLAVTKGWNLQSHEFRISLASQLSRESDRLAAIASDLCHGGMPQHEVGSAAGQDSMSAMFDQLSVLQHRVHACDATCPTG